MHDETPAVWPEVWRARTEAAGTGADHHHYTGTQGEKGPYSMFSAVK